MFSFGFYNSLNGDRKYDALQVSRIFDGIIEDGVYSNIGEFFATVPGTGMSVIVKSGRAWFDHTWNWNDSHMPLTIEESDFLQTRIDAVVLEVDSRTEKRENSIKIIKGVPSVNPVKPALLHDGGIGQHALAYVTIRPNVTEITNGDIEIVVGKDETPFVQCPLKTVSIEDLFQQWDAEFTEWFDNVKLQLTDNVVTNLQRQIDEKVNVDDKATAEDVLNKNPDKWVSAQTLREAGESLAFNKIGDVVISTRDLEKETGGKWVACDQRVWTKGEIPDEIFEKYRYRIANDLDVDKVMLYINCTYTSSNEMTEPTEIYVDYPLGEYEVIGGIVDTSGTNIKISRMGIVNYKDPNNPVLFPSTSIVPSSFEKGMAYRINDYIYLFNKNRILYKGDINGNTLNSYNIDAINASFYSNMGMYHDPKTNLILFACESSDRGVKCIVIRSVDNFSTYTRINVDVSILDMAGRNLLYNGGPFSRIQSYGNRLYLLGSQDVALSTDLGITWKVLTLELQSVPTNNETFKGYPRYIDKDGNICMMYCLSNYYPNSISIVKYNGLTGAFIKTVKINPPQRFLDSINVPYIYRLPEGTTNSMPDTRVNTKNPYIMTLSRTKYLLTHVLFGRIYDTGEYNNYCMIFDTENESIVDMLDLTRIGDLYTGSSSNESFNKIYSDGNGLIVWSDLDKPDKRQYINEKTNYNEEDFDQAGTFNKDPYFLSLYNYNKDIKFRNFAYGKAFRVNQKGIFGILQDSSGSDQSMGIPPYYYSFDKIRAPYIENGYIKISD